MRALVLIALTSIGVMELASCTKDVDLGGTTTGLAAVCEPCATSVDCVPGAACAPIGAHLFCARLCSAEAACADGARCRADASPAVCVPPSDACATAPPAADGGGPSRCGPLVAPAVSAGCDACKDRNTDCQANGCYGGYWCNTTTNGCHKPPTTCAAPI